MKRIDIIESVIAFVLIVLMFGALGGIDSERIPLTSGMAALLVIFCGILADVSICEKIRDKTKKHIVRKAHEPDEMQKGA